MGTCGTCETVIVYNGSNNEVLSGIPSAVACQNNCNEKPDCNYWQYDSALSCYLFFFAGPVTQYGLAGFDVISGPKKC